MRPIPSKHADSTHALTLAGYGVALDLKKMEYLALDDRHQGKYSVTPSQYLCPNFYFLASQNDDSKLDDGAESTSEVDTIINLVHQYPENLTAEYTSPLTSSEVSQIGLQCTQLVYDSEEPLSTLKQITQNFPKYASAIARRVTAQPELEKEVQSNHAKAQPGVNMVWLNGLVVPESDMNPFLCVFLELCMSSYSNFNSLLRTLRKERKTMESLTAVGLTSSQAFELLTHPSISASQSQSGVLDGIFDASDRPEGGNIIVWWNDFENDSRQVWRFLVCSVCSLLVIGTLDGVHRYIL